MKANSMSVKGIQTAIDRVAFLVVLISCAFLLFQCKPGKKGETDPEIVSIKTSFSDFLLPAPVEGGFKMEDYWVWCGSPMKGEDGRYHLFASRWPKKYSFFNGYIFYSEIVRAVSDTPTGPYQFAEVVLPARGEQYWDGRMTHNPTIHRYGDKYLLFYIGTTYAGKGPEPDRLIDPMEPEIQQWKEDTYGGIRIGMATADDITGPWTRQDVPVLEVRKDKWDYRVTTNPAPCVLDDGSILLIYRSNTPGGTRLGVAKADSLHSEFVRLTDDHLSVHVEDPFIWQEGDHFNMLAKDQKGKLTGERHGGVMMTSTDGINWELSENPKAYSRTVKWDNGETVEMANFERPQLLFENGKPAYLFAATADGPGGDEKVSGFHRARNTWNIVVPLDGKKNSDNK